MNSVDQTLREAIAAELEGNLRQRALEAADRAYDEARDMSLLAGLRHCVRAIAVAVAEGVRD